MLRKPTSAIRPSTQPAHPPRAGDDPGASLRWLVRHAGPRLYSLSLRLCRNASDAEDMVQDVFLQAFRRWETYRGESSPSVWLFSIAAHACRARYRRKGGIDRRMPALSQLMPWHETARADPAAYSASPEGEALRAEAADAVHRAILALPEHFRVPLLLRDMLELPTANVAAALGVRPETLKTRLHRARLLVRRAMLERLPSRPAPAPLYERQVCLDLLTAKLDALDASRPFPVADSVLCERCRAVFAELDLAHELGAGTSGADLPQRLRRALVAATDAPCDPVLA